MRNHHRSPDRNRRPIAGKPRLAGRFSSIEYVLLSALAVVAMLFFNEQARAQSTPLRIAAAADLQPVLPPILIAFHTRTGISVDATYQASAALTTQIQNGAPFDLFLSADLGYPRRLIDAGAADARGLPSFPAPLIYARGSLVLWTRQDSKWPIPSLDTLRDPALKRLAIANPDFAPYGRAAISALTSLKLLDALKPRFVTAQSISQTAQFVESGNADAGLISMTSATTEHLKSLGTAFVIPRELYPPLEQGAVIVTKTQQREHATQFITFLLSPAVQQQLAKSGLTPVK